MFLLLRHTIVEVTSVAAEIDGPKQLVHAQGTSAYLCTLSNSTVPGTTGTGTSTSGSFCRVLKNCTCLWNKFLILTLL